MSSLEKYQPPTQIGELDLWAKRLYESGMFKDVKDVAEAFVKVTAGAELGLSPSQSMRGVHVIQGKTIIGAGLLSSLLDRPPYDFTTRFEPSIEQPQSCTITVFKNGVERGQSHFSLDDAKRAGLLKGGGNWEKYPSDMLFARAVSQAARRYAAGALGGAVYVEAHGEMEIQADPPRVTATVQRMNDPVQPVDPSEVEEVPYEPVTRPFIATGKLGDALKALTAYQRETLFEACGIAMVDGKVDPPMKLAETRDKLWQLWAKLGLPDDQDGEPVPVVLLGAIYAARPQGDADEFQRFADTGEDTDPGEQTTIAGEVLA